MTWSSPTSGKGTFISDKLVQIANNFNWTAFYVGQHEFESDPKNHCLNRPAHVFPFCPAVLFASHELDVHLKYDFHRNEAFATFTWVFVTNRLQRAIHSRDKCLHACPAFPTLRLLPQSIPQAP